MAFRIWIKRIHLVLALVAAVPVFILTVSGILLVYREPIDEYFAREYRDVVPGPQKLSIEEMKQKLEAEIPGKTFVGVVLPPTDNVAYNFWMKEVTLWEVAYIDPYTGKFLGRRAWEDATMANFVWWLTDLHMTLKAGRPGAIAMGIVSLLLCASAITGIILWWPRKSKFSSRNFVPKTAKRWKQSAWQLHPVLGFYSSVVLLVVTLTGAFIVWYTPMKEFMHTITLNPPPIKAPEMKATEGLPFLPAEKIIAIGSKELWDKHQLKPLAQAMHLPNAENAVVEISYQGDPSLAWIEHMHVFVHGQTGEVLGTEIPKLGHAGEKITGWVGAAHFGSWGAIWGPIGDHITRIIYILVMLCTLFLMVSGFSLVKKSVWRKMIGRG